MWSVGGNDSDSEKQNCWEKTRRDASKIQVKVLCYSTPPYPQIPNVVAVAPF